MIVGNKDMSFQGNLAEINNLLTKMENEGEIDFAIIPKIENSMKLLTEFQNRIVTHRAADPKTDFLAYHIVRNINLTLEKMKFRFLIAKENRDNPIVAEDSQSLIPIIAESFQVAENIMNGQLTNADEPMIVERIRVLRESMFSSSMLITGDEESKRVSQAELRKEGERLANAVKDLYAEEQQDSS